MNGTSNIIITAAEKNAINNMIIVAEETAIKQNKKEMRERENVAGLAIIRIATAWNERQKLDKKFRSNFIQIGISCSPIQGELLNKLVEDKMINSFGWKKNSFGVKTEYSKGTRKLFVTIDINAE